MTLRELKDELDDLDFNNIDNNASVMFVPDGILSEAILVGSVQAIVSTAGKNVVLLGAYPVEVGR